MPSLARIDQAAPRISRLFNENTTFQRPGRCRDSQGQPKAFDESLLIPKSDLQEKSVM